MRLFTWLAVIALALAPVLAWAQETVPQDEDPVDRILRRVEAVLDDELARLRAELRAILRRELGLVEEGGDPQRLEQAFLEIDERILREYLRALAGDDFEGRGSGHPGEVRATAYIARAFAEAGLRPVGDRDAAGNPTYFQAFAIGAGGLSSRNCVGLLEGSDPVARNEIVVLGGHHDHLGRAGQVAFGALGAAREDDDIYNGADDNASGTGTILAIARAFGRAGLRPRRSILFMTFGAEERGLIGSRYYVNHPIFPLEATVAMINLDMVGRNAHRPVGIYGVGESPQYREIVDAAAGAAGLSARLIEETSMGFGDSDHSSFRAQGIPVMFFFTGLHGNYHRVDDHYDRIEYENLARIGRTAALIVWELADTGRRPSPERAAPAERQTPAPAPAPAGGRPGTRTIGIYPAIPSAAELDRLGLGADQGAVEVERVIPGSVAERAGLERGDWILSIGGRTIPRDDPPGALRRILGEVAPERDIPIVILRDAKRLEFTVRWDS